MINVVVNETWILNKYSKPNYFWLAIGKDAPLLPEFQRPPCLTVLWPRATVMPNLPRQVSPTNFLLDCRQVEPRELCLWKRSIGLVYEEDNEDRDNYYRAKVSGGTLAMNGWFVVNSGWCSPLKPLGIVSMHAGTRTGCG